MFFTASILFPRQAGYGQGTLFQWPAQWWRDGNTVGYASPRTKWTAYADHSPPKKSLLIPRIKFSIIKWDILPFHEYTCFGIKKCTSSTNLHAHINVHFPSKFSTYLNIPHSSLFTFPNDTIISFDVNICSPGHTWSHDTTLKMDLIQLLNRLVLRFREGHFTIIWYYVQK